MAGIPIGIALSVVVAILIGLPTFRLSGHYFSMATIAVAELIRIFTGTWDLVGPQSSLQGPAVRAAGGT
jgi:branched-chain amino acid transport system permease protein